MHLIDSFTLLADASFGAGFGAGMGAGMGSGMAVGIAIGSQSASKKNGQLVEKLRTAIESGEVVLHDADGTALTFARLCELLEIDPKGACQQ